MSRNGDGIVSQGTPSVSILRAPRSTAGSYGQQDCSSVGGRCPQTPVWETIQHSSSLSAETGVSIDEGHLSENISPLPSGGRHIQTRELAPPDKARDVDLRRELSDFIRHAKRGNVSVKKKVAEIAVGTYNPQINFNFLKPRWDI